MTVPKEVCPGTGTCTRSCMNPAAWLPYIDERTCRLEAPAFSNSWAKAMPSSSFMHAELSPKFIRFSSTGEYST